MAKKAETKLKESVLSALHSLPNAWVTKIQQVSIRGTPDIIGCINGYFIAIELKTDSGELDPLQEFVLNQIAESGGVGLVVTPKNWRATFTKLRAISEGREPDFH